MRKMIAALEVAAGIVLVNPAGSQTLNVVKSIDAPHCDGKQASRGPTFDTVNVIQDRLVALDWDEKTLVPYLARPRNVSPDACDFARPTKRLVREDTERTRQLSDKAGWTLGPHGMREKDGMRRAPKIDYAASDNSGKVSEAGLGYLRRIGIDRRLTPWDFTIEAAKIGEQDHEMWTAPYTFAGDRMNPYFESRNIPASDRTNWNDPLLAAGKVALQPSDRENNVQTVQDLVMGEHQRTPVLNGNMPTVTSKHLKGERPHMLYQNTVYKGLDLSF